MTFPTWYLPLLVYFIGSTASSLLQRRLALDSKVPPRLVTALLYACFLMPVGIVIALTQGNLWINWQPITVILLIVEAIGIGGFFAFAFQLNKQVDATQYVVVSNMYTVVTVLLGVFVLHEAFSGQQFIGMVLLILGSILVSLKGIGRKAWHMDRHTMWLALASVGLGVGLAAERACLDHMSHSTYVLLGWGLQTLMLCLFAYRDRHFLPRIKRSEWRAIAKLGAARVCHNTGFFLAVVISRNVSLIASITSFRVPLVFVTSYLLLRERDHLSRRFAGVAIATVGLLLL